ncbi:MAG: M24 family metallopeptidase [Deltaproteobacteria bacterium]|nr:M24 family metallopeptidase [Deltaproteobacteria bacterium]MPZ93251.1 M24 family metallopeptidase [Actinomycetota bacterium]
MPNYTPGLAYGPGTVDWQRRVEPDELRRQRAGRAQAVLQENGIAAVLAGGQEYRRYLSGLSGPEFAPALWYVLFTARGETVSFMHAGYIMRAPEDSPWVSEWRIARSWLRGAPGVAASVHESRVFAADVKAELQRLGILDERIAIAGFDQYAWNALGDAGINITPGDPLLHEAMAVKTPMEIECFKMAGAITDRVWSTIARNVRAGMTDGEASALASAAGASAGADSTPVGFRAGPLVAERGIRGTNQILLPGQLAIVNACGTSFLGYKSCVYRTFAIDREPSSEETKWMTSLQERLGAVIDLLRPGRETGEAAMQFPPATTWGLQDEVEVLTMEIGHGIGLHQYEQPIINRQWSPQFPQEIQEGMVIAVEGREGRPGDATVRLENMVVVTEDGPLVIDRYPATITPLG